MTTRAKGWWPLAACLAAVLAAAAGCNQAGTGGGSTGGGKPTNPADTRNAPAKPPAPDPR